MRQLPAALAAAREFAVREAGGRAELRVILVLAAVLGLNGADNANISASAAQIEGAFHIGNTEIGLLLTVVSLGSALITIPVGILADRIWRTRLLAFSITLWAVATLLSGLALSYLWLILARSALGVVSGTAGPVIASLTGDYFRPGDRARIYGLILSGDLVGTGVGFVVSGDLSVLVSWRLAISWLVLPSLAVAWASLKLPEPERGATQRAAPMPGRSDAAAELVRRAHVKPQPDLVLHSDPTRRSVWWAIRYVLRVRTNVVIIVASSLGYFYFAGLRTFAILYATRHYSLSKPVADSLVLVVGGGALLGIFAGGRVADRMLRRGHVNARVIVPAVCLLAIGPILAPALATTSIAIALPLLTAGATLLGAPNPPLDAARLDIIHPGLWGRAEAVRSLLRTLAESAAPTIFGYASQYWFSGRGALLAPGGASGISASVSGLEVTFLIFLIPVTCAGLLALLALRTYPGDVATADASVAATGGTAAAAPPPARPGGFSEGERNALAAVRRRRAAHRRPL